MRAVRYHGNRDVRFEEIPEPILGPGQVKIAPAFVGICGSDLHEYLGGPISCPTTPHKITGETIPIILGHEFSGVITEIGTGVSGLKVGQACAIRPNLSCGQCVACQNGAQNVCAHLGFIGLSGGAGGLCESICIDPRHVNPLPDNVSLEIGALVEPLSVAWHAISTVPTINSESTILIIGGGPIGLAAILCLKAKGVSNIYVSEISEARQAFATNFGATRVINPIKEDVTAIVMENSNNKGADVVFDCAGVPSGVKTAFAAVKATGNIVNVAVWEKEIAFNPNLLTMKEISYSSVLAYSEKDFKSVIELLGKGMIKAEGMITSKIKLEATVQDGLEKLISDKDNQVKILVDINAK